jgi:hypothetical protein
MRFLRSGVFVATIIVASIGLLSCDFIDDDKVTPPIAVSFPSYQVIYGQHRNRYAIVAPESLIGGGLAMEWSPNNTFLPLTDPFTSAPTTLPLTKFFTEVTLGGVPTFVTQYITQSTAAADEGSMFLHAFDDNTVSPTDYWVAGDPLLNKLGFEQTIYSPYQVEAAISGEKGVVRANNYIIMGNCAPGACLEVANVVEEFTVIDQPLQVIPTALGEFETYRIDYSIVINPTNAPQLTSVLDYRTTCSAGDLTQLVTATGTLWVHPDIGPVKIQNQCSSGSVVTGYTAVLSFTNLTF